MTAPALWHEVGDRCWVRRYPQWDVNVGVVAGSDSLLVIDTRGTLRQGHELREDLRLLAHGPVRWVVNTHVHFDHTFGNAAFAVDIDENLYAHRNAAAQMTERAALVKQRCRENPDADPEFPDITFEVMQDLIDTPPLVPHRTFDTTWSLDLGDRGVELTYFGRGHTDGDVAVNVPDAGLIYVGDLIEESADPWFGDDCFPIDWPDTVAAILDAIEPTATVVPGHGVPVDTGFVAKQLVDLRDVSDTIRELFRARLPLDAALEHRTWPYPRAWLRNAVRRGYAQLSC